MEVNELRKRIATINSTVARLNEQRVKNQGMRETLEKQRSEAIRIYKEKYGVDLASVSVEEEFSRVMLAKEAEVTLMTEVIESIDSGNFDRANQLLKVNVEGAEAIEIHNSGVKGVVDITNIEVQTTPAVQISAPAVENPTPKVSLPVVESQIPTVSTPTVSVAPPPSSVPKDSVSSGVVMPSVAPPPMTGLNIPPVNTAESNASRKMQGLDLSGLQVNVDAVNRATDFSSILSGNMFTP